MTAPPKYLKFLEPDWEGTNYELLISKVSMFGLFMVGVAIVAGGGKFTSIWCFEYLGTIVTYSMRKEVYQNIIEKNLGWFDEKENGTSVLTSAMSTDSGIINGVGTSSISP
jgi:ABC-type multidrug transport system fused ATPase/permease subunit